MLTSDELAQALYGGADDLGRLAQLVERHLLGALRHLAQFEREREVAQVDAWQLVDVRQQRRLGCKNTRRIRVQIPAKSKFHCRQAGATSV